MRINTNLTALNTFNSYTAANNKIADSVAKLSSGYSINSAADNAAGLAISEKMRAQIRGLDTAASNSQDAISLVQTAEGALESADEILQRMREIAVQSSSDTNEDKIDREALQAEFEQLQAELDEIAEDSTFNNQNLLDGSLSTTQRSVGSNTDLSGSGMNVSVGNAKAGMYNFSVGVVTTQEAVSASVPTDSESSFAASTLSSEFSSGDVTIGSSADASSLLNGNYELSAAYDEGSETITVTATGDNDQAFTCTINNSDLTSAIGSGDAVTLDFGDDAFSVELTAAETLTAAADATTSELSALSDAIGGSFTVAGGSDAVEAQQAVMANLTGAASVELEAGADSVTFGNGVTVSFEELTAADLDTSADQYLTVASTAGTSTFAGTTHFDAVALSAIGTHAISDSYTISAELSTDGTTITATATGDDGDVLTASTSTLSLADDGTLAMAFTDGQGNAAYTATFTANGAQDATGIIAGFADTTIVLTKDAAAISMVDYNFENVFGDTSLDATGTADTGVSNSAVEVTSTTNDGLTIQVGANSGDELSINIDCASAQYLGVSGLDVSSQESAASAIDAVDDALNQVSSQRAYLGAIENRLDYKIDNLETSSQNLTSAESAIRDVDMASEMTAFTNANILSQAATAMLAQANSLPQNVLSLLG